MRSFYAAALSVFLVIVIVMLARGARPTHYLQYCIGPGVCYVFFDG